MNLHEYQAKEQLKKYNVPVQEGITVDNAGAAEEAYKQLKVQFGHFGIVNARRKSARKIGGGVPRSSYAF